CGRLDKAYSLGALDAYRAALDDLNDDVIEGDQLAQLVLRWAPVTCKAGPVRYGSTELLHVLNAEESALMRPKGWPTTGKVLSDRLKRLQPTLASRGVLIEWGRTKTARYIEIKAISPVVPAARPPAEQPPLYAATG
ncbi:ATP-binding protein, partial [Kitasatospora sp. NPDC001309]